MPQTTSKPLPAPIIAIAGWVLPGLGYWLIGQRTRALTVGLVILAMFAFGMLVGGMRVADAPDSPQTILAKPWFIGQALVGPVGLYSAHYASVNDFPISQNHVHEIGTLYTAVAGMLNLMAIMDASYRAGAASEEEPEE